MLAKLLNKNVAVLVILCLSITLIGCVTQGTYQGQDFDIAQPGDAAPVLSNTSRQLKLLIIGGTSGIGLELTKLAIERGHQVWALSRNPQKVDLLHPNLNLVAGNILKPDSIEPHIAGKDAIVSAIGLPAGSTNVTLFSEGMRNLIPLMSKHSVTRLISISAVGVGDAKDRGGFIFDNLLAPWVLADDLADKARAEKLIEDSNLSYTIIRPAILNDDDGTRDYRVLTDLSGVKTGYISRTDVAHLILASLEQALYVNRTITISQ